jgi:hypothetical protein
MITREEEIQCFLAALNHCTDRTGDHETRRQKTPSWFEFVAQMAEAMTAEWVVAKRLGYDYQPGKTLGKSTADVGEHIEVKWSANPASNLWIQESDRHDRDVAVLVVGNTPKMHIVGWIPVVMAKKPRYRNNSQSNWTVPQINLQPIETLMRSNYAHPVV